LTTPYERSKAVLGARRLLQELAALPVDSEASYAFGNRARGLLRHFPEAFHLELSAAVLPSVWSNPTAERET
jgi:hypothetical protein